MLNPLALIFLAGIALAGLIVFAIAARGNAKRAARTMLRSIPEGIARAKQNQRSVLVFFLDPKDALTPAILDLSFHPDFARILAGFERVRVDAGADDLDVVNHVAARYGLASVEPPALLVLDRDGRRLEATQGKDALGKTADEVRERFSGFLEKARTRF